MTETNQTLQRVTDFTELATDAAWTFWGSSEQPPAWWIRPTVGLVGVVVDAYSENPTIQAVSQGITKAAMPQAFRPHDPVPVRRRWPPNP